MSGQNKENRASGLVNVTSLMNKDMKLFLLVCTLTLLQSLAAQIVHAEPAAITITIGAALPLTGPVAQVGTEVQGA